MKLHLELVMRDDNNNNVYRVVLPYRTIGVVRDTEQVARTLEAALSKSGNAMLDHVIEDLAEFIVESE